MCLMYLMYNTYLNYKQVEIYIHNKSVSLDCSSAAQDR